MSAPLDIDDKGRKDYIETSRPHDATVETVLAGQVHILTPEQRAAAIALASKGDPGPDYLSWRYAYLCHSSCFVQSRPDGELKRGSSSHSRLFAHGHRDKAVKVLARLHSRTSDIFSPMIQLEIQEIETYIALNGADKRWWDFRPVFATRSYRYRFGLTIITAWWGQIGGNALLTCMSSVNGVTSFIGAMTGVSLIDHLGRRPLMLFSTAMDSINMFLIGALLSPSGDQSPERASAGIAFIYLFAVFFSFGWTPLQALYPSEIYAYEVRAKSIALQAWFISAIVCINTFGLPVALQKIQYKIYVIFGAWNFVGLIFVYIFIVETKRLSLEDLDAVFQAKYPRDCSLELQREVKLRLKQDKESRAVDTRETAE